VPWIYGSVSGGGASTQFRWNHSSQSLHWFKRVLTFSPEFNAESTHIFLTCSLCLLMTSECVWALGEDSNFQLVRGPWNWVLRHFQAERAVWPKLLLKVVSTLKLPIYLYSWFGDCHTQPEIPTLIHVYRLLCWWAHCLPDMLLHKAVAASAKIYMLESHWHSEVGDTSEAYLCLNRENCHVQCCADGCWTTHACR